MIRYKLSKRSNILFVGINPHPGSFKNGVPFSNNKTFWYLLNRSGLIKEDLSSLKDTDKLRHIYNKRFMQFYGLNFLNIINRPTRDITGLKKNEERHGRLRIMRAIKKYKPRIVCFVGKITFKKFSGLKNPEFGWKKDLFTSKVFLMHFPLRGKGKIRINELKAMREIYKNP